MINFSEISKISDINSPPSPLYLFLRDRSTDYNFAAKAFEKYFRSVFNSEIGLQFLINLLSLSFFSRSFIMACLCDEENSLYVLA